MVNSLTELAAGAALSSTIGNQGARLSSLLQSAASGTRINRALDDIASLSAATSLATQTSSLRAASININQASSFLGVAEGGINEIGSLLDRAAQLTVQANSGALNDGARQALNAEFQGIVSEINRVAGGTNFNGVTLLDGSLSGDTQLNTRTAGGVAASGAVNFTAINGGDTLTLNNVQLQEGVDFNAGANLDDTVNNLADALNNDNRFEGVSFEASGNSLRIESETTGRAGNQFTIDANGGASSAAFDVTGDALGGNNVFSLQGGSDVGLGAGDITASGAPRDSIVASVQSAAANASIQFNDAGQIAAGNTIDIGDGEGGAVSFEFVNGAPAGANEIEIGATLEETLGNAATTISNYSGADDFGVRQLQARVEGNQLVLESRRAGNALAVDGSTAISIAETTGGQLSNGAFDNGTVGAIDTRNIAASGFSGELQGFEARVNGQNNVDISVEVGGETFTARNVNTDSQTDQTVTFASENGGSFNVTLQGGEGEAVSNAGDADRFATRLDAAFRGVEFRQEREITNFNASGDFAGASVSLNSADFSNTDFGGVRITQGSGSSFLEVEIGGQTFRSNDLGEALVAGEQVNLTAASGDTLRFVNGQSDFDLGSADDANRFAEGFESAFAVNPNGGGAPFQISASAEGAIQLGIGNFTAQGLGLEGLNLLSADGAARASAAVGVAVDTLASQRADVGAFQHALDFAANNVESAIQNQEAARSVLSDADFAEISTETSLLEAARQAALNSLTQTNRLQSNLLKLIQ